MHQVRIPALAILLSLSWLRLPAAALPPAPPEGLAQFIPAEDTNAVLHNPDLGWVLYENYPLDPDPRGSSTLLTLPDETFPDVDTVALMFSWQDVEAREDRYDFTRVDAAYDYWQKRGKAIQLRLSGESLLWWAGRHPPAGAGIPDYVLARVPAGQKQTRRAEGLDYVVVDARNAFYRARLEEFLRAVNAHFDARRPVTLIDLRGFGLWGEWHSGFRYPDLASRHAALQLILDTWTAALPGHPLALSASYDPDSPPALYAGSTRMFDPAFTTNYHEFLAFSAFDYALTKTNITFRRDGCGGAVHSNERKLLDEAFLDRRRAPMMSEFLGGYAAARKGGTNWVNWLIEDALSLHPNYLSLLGWQGADARDFTRERPDLVALGLRRMGYRLVPIRVQYPRNLTNGVPCELRFDWQNRGTGRALRDFELHLFLGSSPALEAARLAPSGLGTSAWFRGASYSTVHRAVFRRLPAGEYPLTFAVRDPQTGRDIALPLVAPVAPGRYRLGSVRVSR
jgi:hypothetical protein